MEEINIGKYVVYNPEYGKFHLTSEASNTIYRKKELICSYSGADEWCNHLFCQFIDLFSGSSPYNYALGTCNHENEIPQILKENKDEEDPIVRWINKQLIKKWWNNMVDAFEYMFDRLPEEE